MIKAAIERLVGTTYRNPRENSLVFLALDSMPREWRFEP